MLKEGMEVNVYVLKDKEPWEGKIGEISNFGITIYYDYKKSRSIVFIPWSNISYIEAKQKIE